MPSIANSRTEVFTAACVQAAPVFLDLDASIDKACRIIAEAGRAGARLVVFPEGFIPSYPLWVWFIPAGKTHALRELYRLLVANSVDVQGPEIARICAAARKARTSVVLGVNERNTEASGASLYNTLVFVGEDGEIAGRHRKLVPTVGERMVHGRGDGSSLKVYELPVGRLSGLICWENYMPLARYSLFASGAQIHAAPTWDRGEPWLSTLRHIAKEGRVYVLGSCSAVRRSDIPDHYSFKHEFLPDTEWLNPGGSAIVDPDGKFLVEPVYESETILYAEVDAGGYTGPRFQLDVAGHYARPDIFDLRVNRSPQPVLRIVDVIADPGEPSARRESADDAGRLSSGET